MLDIPIGSKLVELGSYAQRMFNQRVLKSFAHARSLKLELASLEVFNQACLG